jgi:formate hydrogenlyase subunit 4
MKIAIELLCYLIGAPILGGLLTGLDRKLTARMQGRMGPPVFQPFYDVIKLLDKENLVVRRSQNFYIGFFLIWVVFTGSLFFTGGDLLLVIFAFTLAGIFFVLAGFKASSPYSFIGAQRELIQMMAYEPAVILTAVGMYMVARTFDVGEIATCPKNLAMYLPGLLFAFVYILAIKLRKSPFDLSTSHHAHQELVKGITTEFSGRALAMIEVAHWYELILILGFVYLFFAKTIILGIAASLVIYVFIILTDNVFARVKWRQTLASAWIVTFIFGMANILTLFFVLKK